MILPVSHPHWPHTPTGSQWTLEESLCGLSLGPEGEGTCYFCLSQGKGLGNTLLFTILFLHLQNGHWKCATEKRGAFLCFRVTAVARNTAGGRHPWINGLKRWGAGGGPESEVLWEDLYWASGLFLQPRMWTYSCVEHASFCPYPVGQVGTWVSVWA